MSRTNSLWVPMPVHTFMHPKIQAAGKDAELVYYRGLMLAKMMGTGNLLDPAMVDMVTRGMRSKVAVVRQMLCSEIAVKRGLMLELLQLPGIESAHGTAPSVSRSAEKLQKGGRRTGKDSQVSGVQRVDSSFDNGPHVGAREEKRREEETFRSPSGSDRNVSARTEPRVAGGAARPAPEKEGAVDGPAGDHDADSASVVGLGELSGPELARANIRKTRSSGKAAQFRNAEWRQRQNEPSQFEVAMAEISKRLPGGSDQ